LGGSTPTKPCTGSEWGFFTGCFDKEAAFARARRLPAARVTSGSRRMFGFRPRLNACRLQPVWVQERTAGSELPEQSMQRLRVAFKPDVPARVRSSG
jgi:hypothetical protein